MITKQVWEKMKNRNYEYVFKIYNNPRIILLSSPPPALRIWTQGVLQQQARFPLFCYPELPSRWLQFSKTWLWSSAKPNKNCIFRLLFQSLVCPTFTFSTEPLPRMAHDDNDFALRTGQFSGSMSQSQRQAAPALEIAPAASLWDGKQCSQQQVSPLTSLVCRSKANGTGKCVCVRLHAHHPSYTCMWVRQESFAARQFSMI